MLKWSKVNYILKAKRFLLAKAVSPFTKDDVDELHDCEEGLNIRLKIGSDE